jgi:hypothetical protein
LKANKKEKKLRRGAKEREEKARKEKNWVGKNMQLCEFYSIQKKLFVMSRKLHINNKTLIIIKFGLKTH